MEKISISANDYALLVSTFKRCCGKIISDVYSQYGYDVYHPQVTSHITWLFEEALSMFVEVRDDWLVRDD